MTLYSFDKVTTTPFHQDCCEHPEGSYICSFISHVGVREEFKVDIYIYPHDFFGAEVCLRVGSEPSEYYSPTSVAAFLQTAGRGMSIYRDAIEALLQLGYFAFVRKEKE